MKKAIKWTVLGLFGFVAIYFVGGLGYAYYCWHKSPERAEGLAKIARGETERQTVMEWILY